MRTKSVGGKDYRIDICDNCSYAFVNPRPSFEFLMKFYAENGHSDGGDIREILDFDQVLVSEKSSPNSTLDAARIVGTVLRLNSGVPAGQFLDVGCGYGFFSRAAIDAGFTVTALELALRERGIAKANTGLDALPCSFEDFPDDSGPFDVILMSQVLEHARDVNDWIAKSKDLLGDNGLLVLALPNLQSIFRMIMQENEPYICPPAHLNFFNPKNLSTLLRRHGFTVEKIQWVSRLPVSSFEKRLPSFCKPLLPLVEMASNGLLSTIDAMRLGMMINVYARKQ